LLAGLGIPRQSDFTLPRNVTIRGRNPSTTFTSGKSGGNNDSQRALQLAKDLAEAQYAAKRSVDDHKRKLEDEKENNRILVERLKHLEEVCLIP